MQGKFMDITGQRFGHLTAIEKVTSGKHAKWRCLCDCGNYRITSSSTLRSGRIKSCGCSRREGMQQLVKDLTGKVFNYLTVIKRVGYSKYGTITWLCKCKCGNDVIMDRGSLVSGNTKSCGCYDMESKSRRGKESRRWQGGRTKSIYGYIKILMPEHPRSDKAGYVLEHVLIMGQYMGRVLEKGEKVHHKNGVRDDNRIENLELWIKGHPPCQRIEDLIPYWKAMLEKYDIKK